MKNYWDIWLIENHQLNDNNAEIIFMVMLWSNHYYLLWIYINSPSESQYYFFKQPVKPCKHCKKFPRDTYYNQQNSFNELHTSYTPKLFSRTSIGNLTSGNGVGLKHWKAFTIPTKLWAKSCRNDNLVVESVWLLRISLGELLTWDRSIF